MAKIVCSQCGRFKEVGTPHVCRAEDISAWRKRNGLSGQPELAAALETVMKPGFGEAPKKKGGGSDKAVRAANKVRPPVVDGSGPKLSGAEAELERIREGNRERAARHRARVKAQLEELARMKERSGG